MRLSLCDPFNDAARDIRPQGRQGQTGIMISQYALASVTGSGETR